MPAVLRSIALTLAVACSAGGPTDDTEQPSSTDETDETDAPALGPDEGALYRFLADQQHPETGLLESFVDHADLPDAFSQYLADARPSFVYDDALAVLAFLARGEPDDRSRATVLLDALLALQRPDGAVPDVVHVETLAADARASTGNQAWLILAFLAGFEQLGEERYLLAAERIAAYLLDPSQGLQAPTGFGGYRLAPGETGVATEHNLDLAPAFQRLATHLPTSAGRLDAASVRLAARRARIYAESRFDPRDGRVVTGSASDGIGPDDSVLPVDTHTWSVLALGRAKWVASLELAQRDPPEGLWVSSTACPAVQGPSYSDADVGEVWTEGLAQLRLAADLAERPDLDALDASLQAIQDEAPNTDGAGLVAACDTVQTGFGSSYFNSLAVGATAWAALASRRVDPFWFTSVDDGLDAHPLADLPTVRLEVPPDSAVSCTGDRPCFFDVEGASTSVAGTSHTIHLLVQPTFPVKVDRFFTQATPATVAADGSWSVQGQLGDGTNAVSSGDRMRVVVLVVDGDPPPPSLTSVTPDSVPGVVTTTGVVEVRVE